MLKRLNEFLHSQQGLTQLALGSCQVSIRVSESPFPLRCPTSLTSFFSPGGRCRQNIPGCLGKSYSTLKHFDEQSYKSCLLMDMTKLQQPWTLVGAKPGQGKQKGHHGEGRERRGEEEMGERGAHLTLPGNELLFTSQLPKSEGSYFIGGSVTATRKEFSFLLSPQPRSIEA